MPKNLDTIAYPKRCFRVQPLARRFHTQERPLTTALAERPLPVLANTNNIDPQMKLFAIENSTGRSAFFASMILNLIDLFPWQKG